MLRFFQIVVIGAICAGVFALLYGNSAPVAVSFFGSNLATGSLGSFLLVSFFTGVFLASLGAFFFGIRQSFHTRRVASQNRRLRAAWDKFSDAQLCDLLGDHSRAETIYTELVRTTPEATTTFAPLAKFGSAEGRAELPETGSALVDFLQGQSAERERSYVRATERYSAAFDKSKIPALLRFARDAAMHAELFDKARSLQHKLSQSTKLSDADSEVEALLAAKDLPTTAEERPSKLRDLVRRYPNCAALVEELAALESAAGKNDQAALLLGRAARLNPSPDRIAAFESQLRRLSLERALSVIEQSGKGAPFGLFLPTRLATLLHQRAISSASELWSTIEWANIPKMEGQDRARLQQLGSALALLSERRDAAVESLLAIRLEDSVAALTSPSDAKQRKVVGLAPQYSTP